MSLSIISEFWKVLDFIKQNKKSKPMGYPFKMSSSVLVSLKKILAIHFLPSSLQANIYPLWENV